MWPGIKATGVWFCSFVLRVLLYQLCRASLWPRQQSRGCSATGPTVPRVCLNQNASFSWPGSFSFSLPALKPTLPWGHLCKLTTQLNDETLFFLSLDWPVSPSFLDEFSCLREGFLNLLAGVQSVKQTGKIPKQFRPKNERSCFLKSQCSSAPCT